MSEDRQEYTVAEAVAAGLLPKGGSTRRSSGDMDSADKTELQRELWIQVTAAGWFMQEEFYFGKPRRWRADWAIAPLEGFAPAYTWLIEYEGGEFAWKHDQEAGKHQAQRFAPDAIKYNEMILLGYRLLRFTASMVRSGVAADQLRRAMEA